MPVAFDDVQGDALSTNADAKKQAIFFKAMDGGAPEARDYNLTRPIGLALSKDRGPVKPRLSQDRPIFSLSVPLDIRMAVSCSACATRTN
jgi:hypothetical protein